MQKHPETFRKMSRPDGLTNTDLSKYPSAQETQEVVWPDATGRLKFDIVDEQKNIALVAKVRLKKQNLGNYWPSQLFYGFSQDFWTSNSKT